MFAGLTIGAAAKAVLGFLKAIPWQLWLGLALFVAVWQYGDHRYDAGVATERAAWQKKQRKADEAARLAQAERDESADKVNLSSDARAAAAVTDTRTETAAAVERVRYEIREIEVPAGCPVALPDRVRAEGRAAVERARAAGDPLRAGRDP